MVLLWYMMILCGPKLITWSVLLLLCICIDSCSYSFMYLNAMAKTQVGFIPINRCIDIAWTIATSRTHIPIAYRFDVWFAIENFGTFASNVSFTYIATMICTWIQFAHQNEQWISLIQCPSVFLSSAKVWKWNVAKPANNRSIRRTCNSRANYRCLRQASDWYRKHRWSRLVSVANGFMIST